MARYVIVERNAKQHHVKDHSMGDSVPTEDEARRSLQFEGDEEEFQRLYDDLSMDFRITYKGHTFEVEAR